MLKRYVFIIKCLSKFKSLLATFTVTGKNFRNNNTRTLIIKTRMKIH